MGKFIDLTGKQFGKLIAKEHIGFDKGGNAIWRCLCECGSEVVVRAYCLKDGNTKSCGCYNNEKRITQGKRNRIELVGRTINNLVVLKRVDDKIQPSGHRVNQYLCLCSCGKEIIVLAGSLQKGQVSCGCLSESFIASELKKYFAECYEAITEYKIFQNPDTNQWLRCDIYLPNKNVFIEVNGIQHYKLNSWHVREAKRKDTTPEEEFAYQKKKDRMKRKFARQNGVYIEVDLRKIESVDEAIKYIEKYI